MATVAPAPGIDYNLADIVPLDDVPKRWPIFTINELKRAALSGDLPHIVKGRRRFITEAHLKQWLKQKERRATWEKENGSSSSGDSGSRDEATAPASIGSGMTPEQESFVAAALRRQISKKPSSNSRRSSDKD